VNVCFPDTKNANKADGCRPLAGIEPALLAELDFESSASRRNGRILRLIFYRLIFVARLGQLSRSAIYS
jgi:hypothetical protein